MKLTFLNIANTIGKAWMLEDIISGDEEIIKFKEATFERIKELENDFKKTANLEEAIIYRSDYIGKWFFEIAFVYHKKIHILSFDLRHIPDLKIVIDHSFIIENETLLHIKTYDKTLKKLKNIAYELIKEMNEYRLYFLTNDIKLV